MFQHVQRDLAATAVGHDSDPARNTRWAGRAQPVSWPPYLYQGLRRYGESTYHSMVAWNKLLFFGYIYICLWGMSLWGLLLIKDGSIHSISNTYIFSPIKILICMIWFLLNNSKLAVWADVQQLSFHHQGFLCVCVYCFFPSSLLSWLINQVLSIVNQTQFIFTFWIILSAYPHSCTCVHAHTHVRTHARTHTHIHTLAHIPVSTLSTIYNPNFKRWWTVA